MSDLDNLLFDIEMSLREVTIFDERRPVADALQLLPRCQEILKRIKAEETRHGKAKENA